MHSVFFVPAISSREPEGEAEGAPLGITRCGPAPSPPPPPFPPGPHPPSPPPHPSPRPAALNSEQKALLDFLVLARSQKFAGFGSSTFSFYLREYRALYVSVLCALCAAHAVHAVKRARCVLCTLCCSPPATPPPAPVCRAPAHAAPPALPGAGGRAGSSAGAACTSQRRACLGPPPSGALAPDTPAESPSLPPHPAPPRRTSPATPRAL